MRHPTHGLGLFKWIPKKIRTLSFLMMLIVLVLYNQNQLTTRAAKKSKPPFLASRRTCPNVSRPTSGSIHWSQGRWQREISTRGAVYLYSAFYDDRPLAGGFFIRVVLMATRYADMKLFCHVWYEENADESAVVPGILKEAGLVPMKASGKLYFEYLLSCPLSSPNPIPKLVSVTEEEDCKQPTNLLPVLYEHHREPPVEFGLCVVNGYGQFSHQELAEWFEFYRLVGVKEFNLYNTSYMGVDLLFKYYHTQEKILNVQQIPHPLGPDSAKPPYYSRNRIRNLRTTCLNDCMMKNMYRYRYLVVVDHDEFIVPRGKLLTLHDLIEASVASLETKEEVMSVGFRNTYFLKSLPPDLYKPEGMTTLRYRFRTKPLGPYTGSKSILRPAYCLNLMNHYCYTRLPLYNGTVSHFAPERLSMSHHYRLCGRFNLKLTCSELHAQKIQDDELLKYEGRLVESVQRVLERLDQEH